MGAFDHRTNMCSWNSEAANWAKKASRQPPWAHITQVVSDSCLHLGLCFQSSHQHMQLELSRGRGGSKTPQVTARDSVAAQRPGSQVAAATVPSTYPHCQLSVNANHHSMCYHCPRAQNCHDFEHLVKPGKTRALLMLATTKAKTLWEKKALDQAAD